MTCKNDLEYLQKTRAMAPVAGICENPLVVLEMERIFPKEREEMRMVTDVTAPRNALLLAA